MTAISTTIAAPCSAAAPPARLQDQRPRATARRAERQRQAEVRARLAPLRQQAKAAERELEHLTAERAALAARLADGATYERAGDEIAALIKREAELKAAIEAAEHRWLAAEAALEEEDARSRVA